MSRKFALLIAGLILFSHNLSANNIPAGATKAKAAKKLEPYFASIKSPRVNLRTGPGNHYLIEWIFVQAGQPVEIIAEHEHWRKIRDFEGVIGWVHQNMLSHKRSVIIMRDAQGYSQPNQNSKVVAQVKAQVCAKVIEQKGEWVKIKALSAYGRGVTCWVEISHAWGAG